MDRQDRESVHDDVGTADAGADRLVHPLRLQGVPHHEDAGMHLASLLDRSGRYVTLASPASFFY